MKSPVENDTKAQSSKAPSNRIFANAPRPRLERKSLHYPALVALGMIGLATGCKAISKEYSANPGTATSSPLAEVPDASPPQLGGAVPPSFDSDSGGKVPNSGQVVAGLRAGFRSCFQRGMTPSTDGVVRLKLEVGADGQVSKASATQTGKVPKEVVDCIVDHGRKAKFAPADGPTTLTIPIQLKQAQ